MEQAMWAVDNVQTKPHLAQSLATFILSQECVPQRILQVMAQWNCGERFVPANLSDKLCSEKTSEFWECLEMSVGGKFRLFQDVLESQFWNRDLCLWRKKMLSHMYWTTCLQSLQIYLLYLYVKVILHHQEVHISVFLLKLCDETNLKGTDWYHCHLYWRKQPPIMTHWFVKLGEKKTVKYGECVWVCEVGGWAVWGCVLCVQRQIDIKLLGHHQWEKDINPPKSCRGRRGQTYGSTSWLITSSHSRAGALHFWILVSW